MEDLNISGVTVKKYVFTNDVLAGIVHYFRRNWQPYEIVSEMITTFSSVSNDKQKKRA